MAIYIKGKKIEETKDFVIYAYGVNPNNLTGQFKLYKDGVSWETLKLSDNDFNNFLSGRIMVKVWKFHQENGYFPDEISRQS